MTLPIVSVVIPCFNGERFLLDAVGSVLEQTFADLELIVVDDGSSDGSLALLRGVEDARVRIITHESNRGIAAARNTGIRAARGRYIGFLDQDDLWYPEKLEKQVPILDGDTEGRIGLVYSLSDRVVDGKRLRLRRDRFHPRHLSRLSRAEVLAYFVRGNFVRIISALVRRECFDALGYLDESITSGADDYDFCVRLAMEYRIACVDSVLVTRRLHGDNYTDPSRLLPDDLRILKRIAAVEPSLEKRRRQRESVLRYECGRYLHERGKRREAKEEYQRSRQANPFNLRAASALLLLSMGPVGTGVLRTFQATKRFIGLGLCVLVAAVIAFAAHGCARSGGSPPNLLLVTIDTLRHDRLGYAGYSRETSPNIDAIAREGVVFRNAYSVAGWTLPAIATIMTGRYPLDHGATDFHWSVDMMLPTIAGTLRRAGYDCRGYVSHVILLPEFGIAEGFEHYDFEVLKKPTHPHDMATSEELSNRIIANIKDLEEPFFMWLHYFDPHFVYLPHDEWSHFGDTEEDRYDQEIAYTDHHFGRVVDELKRKGVYDNTIVMFTSDHGEEFGEHGGVYHYTMYEEVMRVPLVVKVPGMGHRVEDRIVEQIDFFPTVLSLLGLPAVSALPGRDMFAREYDPLRPVFFERDRPPPWNQRTIRVGDKKLTVIAEADTSFIPRGSKGTYIPVQNVHTGSYLYDLDADPGELENLYSDDDSTSLFLLRELAEFFARHPASAQEVRIDEELDAKLRNLGYIR